MIAPKLAAISRWLASHLVPVFQHSEILLTPPINITIKLISILVTFFPHAQNMQIDLLVYTYVRIESQSQASLVDSIIRGC